MAALEALPRVTAAMVLSGVVFTVDPNSYLADASDLGFPPGFFPASIETDMGNGRPLRLVWRDAGRFTYFQEAGPVSLTVVND